MSAFPKKTITIKPSTRTFGTFHVLAGSHCYMASPVRTDCQRKQAINSIIGTQILRDLEIPCAMSFSMAMEDAADATNGDIDDGEPLLVTQLPVNVEQERAYDILPWDCRSRIGNREGFSKLLAADIWLCRVGPQRAIYVRSPVHGFLATILSRGDLFGGTAWSTWKAPGDGGRMMFRDYWLGSASDAHSAFARGVEAINRFDVETLDKCYQACPPEWMRAGDREIWQKIKSELEERRLLLPTLLSECLDKGVFRDIPLVEEENMAPGEIRLSA